MEKISIYPKKKLSDKIRELSRVSGLSMNRIILIMIRNELDNIEKNGINSLYNDLNRVN